MSSRPDVRPIPAALPRLYAILDVDAVYASGLQPEVLLAAWLEAGVTLIQLRAKALALGPLTALAAGLVPPVRRAGARLIVNDRADAAVLSGADGVHVGQDDLSPAEARQIVGSAAIVGLSTHAPAEVAAASDAPIDYLAIGPVFSTRTKVSDRAPLGLDGVRMAVSLAAGRWPVVAIGGITLARAGEVIDAGAASVAVISDLLAGNPADRARAFLRVLG